MRIDKVNCINSRNHGFQNSISDNFSTVGISNNTNKDTFVKNGIVSFKNSNDSENKPTLLDYLLSDDNFHFQFLTDGGDPYYYADCPRICILDCVWGKQELRGRKTSFERSKKVDLINGSDEEIKKIADGICLYDQFDIQMFCVHRKKFMGIQYGLDIERTNKAYARLDKYIEENRNEIKRLKRKIKNFEKKDPENITTKQYEMHQEAIERLEYFLKKGKDFQKDYIDLKVIRINNSSSSGVDLGSFYPSGNY